MATTSRRLDWRVVALVVVLVGAGTLQVVVAAGVGDEDAQLLVIGTASIVMLLALGVVMLLVRSRTKLD
jgi:ABC-type proline/glycine betaine transport system permease subunit